MQGSVKVIQIIEDPKKGQALSFDNGTIVPLKIRKHKRTKKITVRCHIDIGVVTVSHAPYVAMQAVYDFLLHHRLWLEKKFLTHPRTYLMPGMHLPLFGQELELRSSGVSRGLVEWGDGFLLIPGERTFFHRRLFDALKERLLETISFLAKDFARQLDVDISYIRIKEVRSFFGCCSPDKGLTFSWRLIFAPLSVLDYVVAHEVAHLKHLNHSPSFWSVVGLLRPDYKTQKQWLKDYGQQLFAYKLEFPEEVD